MKYRKRPISVEAEQWFPGKEVEGVAVRGEVWEDGSHHTGAYIRTLEGFMQVSPGDYIITGVKGEKYPCKPDIFEMSYEQVEE